jgi:hypothetical protein
MAMSDLSGMLISQQIVLLFIAAEELTTFVIFGRNH